MFENNTVLNKFESREEFIKEYAKAQAKIEEKLKEIKLLEETEIPRIVKEFDYKNYEKKYNADCRKVLGALFGARIAEREIIKHGMLKKM